MNGVRAEPLALEVALAHYAATLPEGKTVPLADIAEDFGCSVEDLKAALEAVIEVEDRDLTIISDIAVEGDWARYGEEIKRLGAVIDQMSKQR